ncbi:hypothetical protein ACKWTF_005045 [Chironomus riparius]
MFFEGTVDYVVILSGSLSKSQIIKNFDTEKFNLGYPTQMRPIDKISRILLIFVLQFLQSEGSLNLIRFLHLVESYKWCENSSIFCSFLGMLIIIFIVVLIIRALFKEKFLFIFCLFPIHSIKEICLNALN